MAKIDILKRQTSAGSTPPGDTDAAATYSHNSGQAARVGWWALGIGLGVFLLWAALAPLDEGVPAQGIVSIDTKRKTVQHLSGGIVKEVLVHEGSHVKEGQLLIKLDDATARANFETIRQRYLGLRAAQGRLLAEQSGQATITYHPDLQAASQDPLIRQQMVTQEQLLQSRRAGLRADLQSIQESILGQDALIQSYQAIVAGRRSQLALLNEELNNTRGLVKDGYAPRNRQMELERMVAESSASIAELVGNTTRARQTIAELRQRAIARQQEYRKEIEAQQADVSREVLSDAEKFRALQDDLNRVEIKAPAAGQVVGLAMQTVGGVVAPGQKLMDIVPDDEPLLMEVRVMPHLIDSVRAGLPVDVRFSAFAHSPQLVVAGKVVSVSGDLLTDQATNMPFYLVRVALTPEGIKQLGKRQMHPGMPVEVVLRTGERSLLTYMLHPLLKRMAASMKEE